MERVIAELAQRDEADGVEDRRRHRETPGVVFDDGEEHRAEVVKADVANGFMLVDG